jgi:O-antigen/teichoic acid export membrane protein
MRRNTAFSFGVQAATSVFTMVLTLFLVRVLGAARFGTFAVALAVGGLVLLPADFGISASAARFLAEAVDNAPRRRDTLAAAFRLKLLTSLAAAIGMASLAGPIAAVYGQPELVWPLRGVALAVGGQGLMRLAVAACASQQRSGLSFAIVTAESFAETTASIALVVAGGGAAGAAFGRAIGYGVGSIAGVVALLHLFELGPRSLFSRPTERSLHRRIAGYAGAIAVVDTVWALFTQIDILLIGAILTSAAAGIFQAPVRLLALVSYPGIALGAAIGPRLARVSANSRPDPRPLVHAARLLLVVQTFGAAVVVAWAVPLATTVLGAGYTQSGRIFAALGPYVVLSGLAPLLSNGIDYVGGTRHRMGIGVISVAVNAAIDVVLLPRIGVIGAAIGTDVGYALYVAGHARVGRELLGMRPSELVGTLGRCLVAGGAVAALLFGGAQEGAAGLAISGVLAVPIYVGLVALLGERDLIVPLLCRLRAASPTLARMRRTRYSA